MFNPILCVFICYVNFQKLLKKFYKSNVAWNQYCNPEMLTLNYTGSDNSLAHLEKQTCVIAGGGHFPHLMQRSSSDDSQRFLHNMSSFIIFVTAASINGYLMVVLSPGYNSVQSHDGVFWPGLVLIALLPHLVWLLLKYPQSFFLKTINIPIAVNILGNVLHCFFILPKLTRLAVFRRFLGLKWNIKGQKPKVFL